MDSKPRCKIVPEPRSKIHQLCYVQVNEEDDVQAMTMLTKDGRIIFYSTRDGDLFTAPAVEGKDAPLPSAKLIAQLGGEEAGSWSGRNRKASLAAEVGCKDQGRSREAELDVEAAEKKGLPVPKKEAQAKGEKQAETACIIALSTRVKDFYVFCVDKDFFIPAASSDSTLRIWKVSAKDLGPHTGKVKHVGTLLGTYEISNRISCMKAFVMLPSIGGDEDNDFEGFDEPEDDGVRSSSSDSE